MTCAETYVIRAAADAELARQYALARELRENPDQVEHVRRATMVISPSDDPRDRGYWTPERIVAVRTGLGMTQREFAEVFGASEGNMYKWETGINRPPPNKIPMLIDLEKRLKDAGERPLSLPLREISPAIRAVVLKARNRRASQAEIEGMCIELEEMIERALAVPAGMTLVPVAEMERMASTLGAMDKRGERANVKFGERVVSSIGLRAVASDLRALLPERGDE